MGARKSTRHDAVIAVTLGLAAAGSLALHGCSSTPAAGGADSGVDAAARPDGSAAGGDAAAEASPACANLRGAYVTSGSCTDPSYALPAYLCARQTGCDLSLDTVEGFALKGTATADGYTTTQQVSGVTQTCIGKPGASGFSMTCDVPSLFTCEGTATPITVDDPAATDTCCDVMAQDCTQPDKACTYVEAGKGAAIVSACVTLTGSGAEGASCTRTSAGHDTCGKGLFCSSNGSKPDDRHCLKLCLKDSQCGSGASCLAVTGAPLAGMCLPSCSPFAEAGGDAGAGDAGTGGCGAGLSCRALRSHGEGPRTATGVVRAMFCSPTGAGAPGAACATTNDCGASSMCWNSACASFCDAAHACAGGKMCATFESLGDTLRPDAPAGLGLCQ